MLSRRVVPQKLQFSPIVTVGSTVHVCHSLLLHVHGSGPQALEPLRYQCNSLLLRSSLGFCVSRLFQRISQHRGKRTRPTIPKIHLKALKFMRGWERSERHRLFIHRPSRTVPQLHRRRRQVRLLASLVLRGSTLCGTTMMKMVLFITHLRKQKVSQAIIR